MSLHVRSKDESKLILEYLPSSQYYFTTLMEILPRKGSFGSGSYKTVFKLCRFDLSSGGHHFKIENYDVLELSTVYV